MRLASLAAGVFVVASAFVLGRLSVPVAPAMARPMQQQATTTFSHFECYQAKFGSPVANDIVQLSDQFQQYQCLPDQWDAGQFRFRRMEGVDGHVAGDGASRRRPHTGRADSHRDLR